LSVIAAVAGITAVRPAAAGGGPENVLLVVNSNSDSSKAIANAYIDMRKIPPNHVLYIDWKGSLETASGENFRDKILLPVMQTLDERKLMPQIDYIIYSSDFPWRVDLKPIYPDDKFTSPFDPIASITGATYLLSFILHKEPAIVMPSNNWYVPGDMSGNDLQCTHLTKVPSRGFRSRYTWAPNGEKTDDAAKGGHYLLCTMLGVTQGRGNTVPEVISYLRRAVTADATRPPGTIYFMWNKDVRSSTRDKCFSAVAAQINALGVKAQVQQGRLPDGAKDVAGLMAGVEEFNLARSNITIRPGAICEHLTSAGGILSAGNFQTPLSEFLRAGAAGASGTVTEPHAIQAKFPLPSLQLHYARGCSLAEAFYQSITGPYQLLIVGEPLCQPWAVFPKILVEGIKPNDKIKGKVSIKPSSLTGSVRAIAMFDLYVDGRLMGRDAANKSLELDTTGLPDGYHEMRIVGTVADAIETQGRAVMPFYTSNHAAALDVKVTPLSASNDGKFHVTVRQPGANSITIRQNSRDVGSVQGEAGEIDVSAATLGRGPSMLQAVSEGDARAVSAPVRVQVE
jgi:uncharacterized protein (TIGR03790 family)